MRLVLAKAAKRREERKDEHLILTFIRQVNCIVALAFFDRRPIEVSVHLDIPEARLCQESLQFFHGHRIVLHDVDVELRYAVFLDDGEDIEDDEVVKVVDGEDERLSAVLRVREPGRNKAIVVLVQPVEILGVNDT